MIFLRYLLLWGGVAMIAAAIIMLSRDLYQLLKHNQARSAEGAAPAGPGPAINWKTPLALALIAWGPIILSSGILPGTLYSGAHFITPLAESIVLFDTRDQLFTTGAMEDGKTDGKTVSKDMTKVTNPPGTACFTYKSCLSLINAGKKINYEGASGDLDYNSFNNTFGPYGAFQVSSSGTEQQVSVMDAKALAAATP